MAEQCRYMAAAYPSLDAEDTCVEHRHDEQTFALAGVLAEAFQTDPSPSDEQVGWFMDDAGAIVDDFKPAPESWIVALLPHEDYRLFDAEFTVNGEQYVIQAAEKEASYPVRRSTWQSWVDEAESA